MNAARRYSLRGPREASGTDSESDATGTCGWWFTGTHYCGWLRDDQRGEIRPTPDMGSICKELTIRVHNEGEFEVVEGIPHICRFSF